MGLDTSHNCWHGSYTMFSDWRLTVAEAAGYDTEAKDRGIGRVFETAKMDWEKVPHCALEGNWDLVTPNDPLLVLMAHSDCDGKIFPKQATPLADRLEELLPNILDDWQSDRTRQFIAGLRDAAATGEPVQFH